MKVYLVWYVSCVDYASRLWGVYGTKERAKKEVETIIENEYSDNAWWTEENVL